MNPKTVVFCSIVRTYGELCVSSYLAHARESTFRAKRGSLRRNTALTSESWLLSIPSPR